MKPVIKKYGEFINISYYDKEYYYISFDKSNEEIKKEIIWLKQIKLKLLK